MAGTDTYHGQCACGSIRYRVCGSPAMVGYCHCEDCRKSCGSVVAALAGFRREGFKLLSGNPTYFSNTPEVTRSFCHRCGSPLFYENQNFVENIYIHIGTFDHPECLPADRHTWTKSRVSRLNIADDLPQYEQLSNAGLSENTPAYKRPDQP